MHVRRAPTLDEKERIMEMIVHNGKRYRPEDAQRLGITGNKPKPAAKSRKAAPNKARRSADDKGKTGG